MITLDKAIQLYDKSVLNGLQASALIANGLTYDTVDEVLEAVGNRIELLQGLLRWVKVGSIPRTAATTAIEATTAATGIAPVKTRS